MVKIKQGDLVSRISYNNDIIFKVCNIKENSDGERTIFLRGINVRLMADSPESDLIPATYDEIKGDSKVYEAMTRRIPNSKNKEEKKSLRFLLREPNSATLPGKVVHIDGDGEYLELCLNEYKEKGIKAYGLEKIESEQPKIILDILKKIHPDILVVTGHDGFFKKEKEYADISNYRNSKYFIESVKEARKFESSLDDLIIIAGACQSHYEGILDAGANFASSPGRILIHALDPVRVCVAIAKTNIDKVVTAKSISIDVLSGLEGIGGLTSMGKQREVAPKPRYNFEQGDVPNAI